jgi:hypothetical protein
MALTKAVDSVRDLAIMMFSFVVRRPRAARV